MLWIDAPQEWRIIISSGERCAPKRQVAVYNHCNLLKFKDKKKKANLLEGGEEEAGFESRLL